MLIFQYFLKIGKKNADKESVTPSQVTGQNKIILHCVEVSIEAKPLGSVFRKYSFKLKYIQLSPRPQKSVENTSPTRFEEIKGS